MAKNVTYCIPSLARSGGIERVLVMKANYLSKFLNYNVVICTYESGIVGSFFNIDKNIKIVDFSSTKYTSNILNKISSVMMILHYINKKSPDFFVSVGATEAIIMPFINKNIKTVVEWHFSYNQPILDVQASGGGRWAFLLAKLRRFKNKSLFGVADKLIVLTERDKSNWTLAGVENVSVIHNPSSFSAVLKKNIKSKSQSMKFLSVGRLENQKGFFNLIDIMCLFKKQYINRNWKLAIYGEGSLKTDLLSYIKSKNMEANVSIFSPSNNIDKIMLDSDCFLMTSFYEGLPMVLLEAQACGLPVISYDCETGPREVIKDNVNGFLIEQDDKDKFIEALDNMFNIDLKDMSIAALKNSENFQLSSILDKWNKIFQGA